MRQSCDDVHTLRDERDVLFALSAFDWKDAPGASGMRALDTLMMTGTTTRRMTGRLLLTTAALLAVTGGASAGADQQQSVLDARAQLKAATAVRTKAEAAVADLEARRDVLTEKVTTSSTESSAIAIAVAKSSRLARDEAVRAYIAAGAEAPFAISLDAKGALDASVRTDLLAHSATTASNAAAELQRLREQNDPVLVRLGEQLADVERQLAAANSDLIQAAAFEADAERAVADATARDRTARARATQDAAARLVSTASPSPAAPLSAAPAAPGVLPDVTPGGPSPKAWAKLRECEANGSYTVVSASGKYRGAYQFDVRSWRAVGGTGDPAAAPPAEQDLRASLLYASQGARAWPHCGRHLR